MSLETTLDAYVQAWNTADAQTRAALLAQAVTDDCTLHGPTGSFTGRGALVGLIASLQDRLVGASVVRTGPATDGDRPSFGWEIRAADGVLLFSGEDTFEVAEDGRLRRIQVEF